MATKKEIAQDIGLSVLVPPFGAGLVALTKALKKYKEKKAAAKTKKDKENIQKLIDDLKSEIKLSKGDRGAAEDMPKKKADFNVFLGNIRKHGKPVPLRPSKEQHPLDKRKPFGGAKFKLMKKGSSVSKYSTGGGVRKSKYSL